MRIWLGLVLGAAGAAAVACSAGSARSSATAPAAPAMMSPDERHAADDRHAEIEALDREISDALARGNLAPPERASCRGATCAAAMSQPFVTPAAPGTPGASDASCRPAPSAACTDACTIATSICTNQQKICDLARQLAGDDWAANKCDRARASCTAAHERCCSCVL